LFAGIVQNWLAGSPEFQFRYLTFKLKSDRITRPTHLNMAVEAYCVKCKAKRDMKDPKENTMANGRKAMKGTCPVCGTGMFKIMGNK
jgi:Zn finger protein HypA/HybF involved in hydrogenase expression